MILSPARQAHPGNLLLPTLTLLFHIKSNHFHPKMRLITHNILKCNKKGVKNGYPLKIEITEGGAAHIVSNCAAPAK